MNFRNVLLLFCGSAWLLGCEKSPLPAKTETAPTEAPVSGTPQPKLPTIKLFIGDEILITELALRQHEQQTGMMFRTNMPDNEAMLFVFPSPHQTAFWMKNTFVPLSAAYINPDGVIEEIHKLEPRNTNSVTASSANIQYVLETPQGWFERHNIPTGSVIRTERGSLRETFFQQR